MQRKIAASIAILLTLSLAPVATAETNNDPSGLMELPVTAAQEASKVVDESFDLETFKAQDDSELLDGSTRVTSKSDGDIAQSAPILDAGTQRSAGAATATLDEESYKYPDVAAAQTVKSAYVTKATTGAVRADIRLAAAPSSTALARIDLAFGKWNSQGTCVHNFEIRTIPSDGARAGFVRNGTWQNSYSLSMSRSGATVTVQLAAISAVKNAHWDCVWLRTAIPDADSNLVIVQEFDAEDLARADLDISGISRPVQAVARGKWLEIRHDVANQGKSDATNVKVSYRGKKLKIKPASKSLGTIQAKSTKYGLTTKVKLVDKKKKQKLTITVQSGDGASARRAITVVRKPKATKYRSLAKRYFLGVGSTSLSSSSGWDTDAVWFANKKYVHIGFPKGSKLPRCASKSKTCKRYKYNAKKGTVKIGKQRIKINSRGFTFRGTDNTKRTYYPLTLPNKNARFSFDLVHRDWSGYCLLSCTAVTKLLSFGKNGRFVLGSYAIGSWPGLGSSWATTPPDQRGTYRVIGRGRVELRYANGKIKRFVFAIQHDARNKPSAKNEGVVLGETNYYFED